MVRVIPVWRDGNGLTSGKLFIFCSQQSGFIRFLTPWLRPGIHALLGASWWTNKNSLAPTGTERCVDPLLRQTNLNLEF